MAFSSREVTRSTNCCRESGQRYPLEIIGEPGWDRTIDTLIKSQVPRGLSVCKASNSAVHAILVTHQTPSGPADLYNAEKRVAREIQGCRRGMGTAAILPNSYWALSQVERPRSKARLNLSAIYGGASD